MELVVCGKTCYNKEQGVKVNTGVVVKVLGEIVEAVVLDAGLPVDAVAGGYCTRHLYKAESVGLGWDNSSKWGKIIVKSNI